MYFTHYYFVFTTVEVFVQELGSLSVLIITIWHHILVFTVEMLLLDVLMFSSLLHS